MAHPKATRDKLRALYCNGEQSLETAAALCGVSLGTSRRWRDEAKAQGDDWNKLRAAHTLAGGSIDEIARAMMTSFLVQYQATMTMLQDAEVEDLPPSKRVQLLASLADAFTKTVSANKRVLPEVQEAAVAIKVINRLVDYIDAEYPNMLANFDVVLQGFQGVIEKEF